MFANCSMGGISFAFPDVCKTPSNTGTITLTYPNIASQMLATPMVPNIFLQCGMAHNLTSSPSVTTGDSAGIIGGTTSSSVMSSARHTRGSSKVFFGGGVATRLSDSTQQNSTNANGTTLTPGQIKVLILS